MSYRAANITKGISWFGDAWGLFRPDVGIWLAATVGYFILNWIIMLLPLSSIISSMLSPFLFFGFYTMADVAAQGGKNPLENLLVGFKDERLRNAAFVLGGVNVAFLLVCACVVFVSLGSAGASALFAGTLDLNVLVGMIAASFVIIIILIPLSFIFFLATLYATPLVLLARLNPIEALKESLAASFKNTMPLTIFGLTWILLAFFSTLTFGIGFIVLFPLTILATYASYKDIFSDTDDEIVTVYPA